MPADLRRWLMRRHMLKPEELAVLDKTMGNLDAAERRLYRRRLRPQLASLARSVQLWLDRQREKSPQAEEEWALQVALKVAQNGYATFIDSMVIEAVGRHQVVRYMEQVKKRPAGPAEAGRRRR